MTVSPGAGGAVASTVGPSSADRAHAAGQRGETVQFDQVQQLRAHEYVAEQIRRHIALRLIRQGEALPPERELAAMFGVGRSTVRLALRRLVAEGLIEARRGRTGGTFILERTDEARAVAGEPAAHLLGRQEEIEEFLTYRRTVEPAVARLAAQARTPGDLQARQAALAGMTTAEDEPAYMRYDTEFHVAVARATHNRHLVAAIEQIRVEINDALILLTPVPTGRRSRAPVAPRVQPHPTPRIPALRRTRHRPGRTSQWTSAEPTRSA